MLLKGLRPSVTWVRNTVSGVDQRTIQETPRRKRPVTVAQGGALDIQEQRRSNATKFREGLQQYPT